MPTTLNWNPTLGTLEVTVSGKLAKDDYERLGPKFDQFIKQYGPLRVLVSLEDFHGWTTGGLWEDVKFDFRHYRDLERLAIVGEKSWHEGMAWFCKPFTQAKIRYFENFEIDDARRWLTKEAPPAGSAGDLPGTDSSISSNP